MLRYAQSRANEALPQLTMAEFMASSAYERHLAQLRVTLRRQRERTADAIAAHWPAGTRLSVPEGSMMLWVEMPNQRSAMAVFETALAQAFASHRGAVFQLESLRHYLRISCGAAYTGETKRR
jgi:DNA-binding transcriptional MocR family regulator